MKNFAILIVLILSTFELQASSCEQWDISSVLDAEHIQNLTNITTNTLTKPTGPPLIVGDLNLKNMFGVSKAGNILIYLETNSQGIKTLVVSFRAKLGLFKMQKELNLKDLNAGDEIEFGFQGNEENLMELKAMPGFNRTGGKLRLAIQTSHGEQIENIIVSKQNDQYKAYLTNVNANREIKSLDITLSGNFFKPADMKTHDYQILTNN